MSYGFSGKYVNDSLMNGFPKAPTSNIISYSFPSIASDSDAQAFIKAAVITDLIQQQAINQLVLNLKGYAIWDKFKAIYPFVGGTATTHKWNLKNPLDTNAAFRLTFSGGWIHSSTGAKPNGIDSFANSYLIPSVDLINNFASLHYYSRTSGSELLAGQGTAIGARSNNITANNALQIVPRRFDNFSLFYYTFTGATNELGYHTNELIGTGMFSGSSTINNSKMYKNGVDKTTVNASTFRNTPNVVMYIGAINSNGSPVDYTLRESAFAGIADSMSNTEIDNLYKAVQLFNTTLGRQVI